MSFSTGSTLTRLFDRGYVCSIIEDPRLSIADSGVIEAAGVAGIYLLTGLVNQGRSWICTFVLDNRDIFDSCET